MDFRRSLPKIRWQSRLSPGSPPLFPAAKVMTLFAAGQ
jgi:hypothetical protein